MSRKTLGKIVLILCVLGVALAAWQFGFFDDLSVDQVQATLAESGPWGPLGFVATMTFVQPLGISVYLFLLAAASAWPPVAAIALGYLGTLGSSANAFFFARFVARDWVQERIPDRLRRYEGRLETHGFRTLVLLRLVFFTTPTLSLMMGTSKMRFSTYMAATAVGNIPTVIVAVLMGQRIVDWVQARPVETWPWPAFALGLGAVLLAVAVGWAVARRRSLA